MNSTIIEFALMAIESLDRAPFIGVAKGFRRAYVTHGGFSEANFTVPPLPAIGDLEILLALWTACVPFDALPSSSSRSKSSKFHKHKFFLDMERTGDVYIKMISLEELPRIFGQKNYDLVNLVLDHANSNGFFEMITKHYHLDERIRWYPKDHYSWKFRADIFEAWVGAHVYERKTYDCEDPLRELRSFLSRLWSIRYRELNVFSYNPTMSPAYIPCDRIRKTDFTRINFSQDLLLRKVLGSFVDAPNSRDVGYLVKVEILPESAESATTTFEGFCTSMDEVTNMRQLRIWNAPRKTRFFHNSY